MRLPFFSILLLLSALSARAETLIDLENRRTLEAEGAVSGGGALVYVEKHCPACMAYLRRLGACPEALRQKLVIISLDSPGIAKTLMGKAPSGARLAVRKNEGEEKIAATPLTRTRNRREAGILTCSELEALLR